MQRHYFSLDYSGCDGTNSSDKPILGTWWETIHHVTWPACCATRGHDRSSVAHHS